MEVVAAGDALLTRSIVPLEDTLAPVRELMTATESQTPSAAGSTVLSMSSWMVAKTLNGEVGFLSEAGAASARSSTGTSHWITLVELPQIKITAAAKPGSAAANPVRPPLDPLGSPARPALHHPAAGLPTAAKAPTLSL